MRKEKADLIRFNFMCKYVWLAAAVLLLTCMGAGEGWAKKLPGEKYDVTIIRDDYGVPHVFSDTKEGLGYGCGYAMAQDRLWQADLFRRMAFGNLAEFGLATVDFRIILTEIS